MTYHDDQMVGAYVDGELDDEAVRAFQADLALDPDLQRRVAEVREMDAMLRAWCSKLSRHATKAKPQLPATIEPELRRHRRQNYALWSQALAAGVALLLGIGIGHFVDLTPTSGWRQDELMSRLLQSTLEHTRSGESVTWSDVSSEQRIVVEPLRSYRASGTFCREYRESIGGMQRNTKVIYGLACREPNGPWNVEYTLIPGPRPTLVSR